MKSFIKAILIIFYFCLALFVKSNSSHIQNYSYSIKSKEYGIVYFENNKNYICIQNNNTEISTINKNQDIGFIGANIDLLKEKLRFAFLNIKIDNNISFAFSKEIKNSIRIRAP